MLVYHGITVPLVLTSFGEWRRPKNIYRNGVPPRSTFPLDYTTCDSCYFQIHKLQCLCNVHVTFFKNALSRFNVTSVVRAAVGSVNLLAK